MKLSLHYFFLPLLCLPGALAWGALGHDTTAYLASHFVSSPTRDYLKRLLRDQDDDYLAKVATWADQVRGLQAWKYTGKFHFIDAHDDPTHGSCQVDYARDCKEGGCIISALANYTDRARDRALPRIERERAFKFLVHFIGDLHQPLHNEDVARGGTQIKVRWQKRQYNLHAVWDTRILEQITQHSGKDRRQTAMRWADELAREISSGKYAADKEGWLENFDPASPNVTAMAWSNEANHYVCTHVFPPGLGPKQITQKNLFSNGYYQQAAPVVEGQIARAGFRMAAWLDDVVKSIQAEEGSNETVDDMDEL
ncbi:Phospholipase C/P1 nuclease, core [Metarhizium guizhouense ARSEF 977]|uniref:Phospholipase C/P1 nuclease, core n=1 Tax=Metarhizium guizhouense (strain ARSEF 977) TaxID=1276136 RepID=A0A0B4H383_METGA|nr:Phospholipase C/P1 nuclease, core [Metarhizium guizhouense ARSEF 977]